ncbi:MAG: hypothetical protein QOG54_768 [Actinomycetota bacterium]|jgi:hypothetical protein|nr:hypothetical protein [Actinomycetota bacterium]
MTSLPPQCGGIPIENWDWGDVDDEETAAGVTWGEYRVVGSYDGSTFVVTKVESPHSGSAEDDPIDTPCPEPAGGWDSPDPSKESMSDFQTTSRAAERESDFSGIWIDYIGEPEEGTDVAPFIANIAFTGDIARHETEARLTWGGPLCMIELSRTHAELRRIQDEMDEFEGIEMLWSDVDVTRGIVEVGVIVATHELRDELADRYGAGTVVLYPALIPVEE